MKNYIKRKLFNPGTWRRLRFFFKPFYHIFHDGELIYNNYLEKKESVTLYQLFHKKIVLNGVFKGLIYPDLLSCGSSLFPKLLGSYEKEIQPFFESVRNNNYTEIIDVGCAEGYYAVGLSRMFPESSVYAYDINTESLNHCKSMSEINSAENIKFNSECTADVLSKFPFTGRNLIISDCEGYEYNLFTKAVIPNLLHSDVLIEVHENEANDIFSHLKNIFSQSHDCKEITSISDFEKLRKYNFSEIEHLSWEFKLKTLSEHRVPQQPWLIFTPKKEIVS